MKVENLTNQSAVKIDSISSKINALQIKVEALANQNKILRDSIKALDRTILEADIKTEFFTDDLNFYTIWFSIFLVLLGFCSWKYIIDPIKNESNETKLNFNKFKSEEVHTLISDANEVIDKKINELSKDYKKLKSETSISLSWALKSMMILHEGEDKTPSRILFCFRYLELILKDNYVYEMEKSEWIIKEISDGIKNNIYTQEHYKKFDHELNPIMESIKNSNYEPYKVFYYSVLKEFLEKISTPTTAIEAYPVERSEALESSEESAN